MLTLNLEDSYKVKIHDSDKYWYQNDECHREDGSAVEYANGYKSWYHNGKHQVTSPER